MKRIVVFSFIFLSFAMQLLFSNELIDVASGKNHSLLLFKDGKLLPFGSNSNGQLGFSKTIDNQSISDEKFFYVDIPVKFISIAVGLDFSLAVGEDGSLWGWGSNRNFQLGLKESKDFEKPQLLSDSKGWKKVFAGGYESLALKEDGSLWKLCDYEIIQNPNEKKWKDVKIFGDTWGLGDYSLIVVLQDIANKFWVYGTCNETLDDLSIINAYINKSETITDFDNLLQVNISSEISDFQTTDLSGIYKNKYDTVIFGITALMKDKIIQIPRTKEPVYNYLSGIAINVKNTKIKEFAVGNFTDKTTLSLDISRMTDNFHYYSYAAILQKNGQLIVYTNGEKKKSDKKIKIRKLFGGNNIFIQGYDEKIYGIGYFYTDTINDNQNNFNYFIPITYE